MHPGVIPFKLCLSENLKIKNFEWSFFSGSHLISRDPFLIFSTKRLWASW